MAIQVATPPRPTGNKHFTREDLRCEKSKSDKKRQYEINTRVLYITKVKDQCIPMSFKNIPDCPNLV